MKSISNSTVVPLHNSLLHFNKLVHHVTHKIHQLQISINLQKSASHCFAIVSDLRQRIPTRRSEVPLVVSATRQGRSRARGERPLLRRTSSPIWRPSAASNSSRTAPKQNRGRGERSAWCKKRSILQGVCLTKY